MFPLSKRNIFEPHTNIINKLIKRFGYKSYLEIGVSNPDDNFNKIEIEFKEGCDISDKYPVTYQMTSDEMFKNMPEDKKYDIIFIDGMHDEEYVDRDISNSLKHLNEGGLICLHDTIPQSELANQKYDEYQYNIGVWNGNVWRSIVKLNLTGLPFYTIDNGDYGFTIIPNYLNIKDIDLTQYKLTAEYKHLFYDNHFIFNCVNLQGRYALHVIDVLDFENIFGITE